MLLSAGFLLANVGECVNSSVKANSIAQSKTALPAFLEKGKTYQFTFAFSMGEYSSSSTPPVRITGRVERLDADAGWVYINHYVAERKGKVFEYKFQGYSWININQVYECSEMTPGI